MTCTVQNFERVIRPDNTRQDFVNSEIQDSLYDDGVLDIYIDLHGSMRNNGVRMIGTRHSEYIEEALYYFEEITGIKMNYVDSEYKSELSFHQLNSEPGQGFERWDGVDVNTKGLIHAKGDQDTNIYFEDMRSDDRGYTKHVIFHEIAHAFGAYELLSPGSVSSEDTIMGYDYNGFHGYTESDQALFESIF